MKTTGNEFNLNATGGPHSAAPQPVRLALNRTRNFMVREYSGALKEHAQLLTLALNEAEALAWQTGLPQLFFPALAEEKVQAAVRWNRRQRARRIGPSEIALAE